MSKAPLKVKRCEYTSDKVSYDARMTKDKTGFNIRIEGAKPATWGQYLMRVAVWVNDELDALGAEPSDKEH